MRKETIKGENSSKNPPQQNIYFTIVKINCNDKLQNYLSTLQYVRGVVKGC